MALTWFFRRQHPQRIGLPVRSALGVEQLEDRTACSAGPGLSSATFGVTPTNQSVESRLLRSAPNGSVVQVQTDGGASFLVQVGLANNVEQMQINMQSASADASPLFIGDHPIRVSIRDVNGNGTADIVIRDVLAAAHLVLQGTGAGVFVVPHPDRFIDADPFGANVMDPASMVHQLRINFGSIDLDQIRTFVASALDDPHCFAEFEKNLGHVHLLTGMNELPLSGNDGSGAGRNGGEDALAEPAARDGTSGTASSAAPDGRSHPLGLRPRVDFSSRGPLLVLEGDLTGWTDLFALQPGEATLEIAATEGSGDPAPPVLTPLLGTEQAVVPTLLAAPRPHASSMSEPGPSEPTAGGPVVIGLGAGLSRPAKAAAHRCLLDRVFAPRREENAAEEQDGGDSAALAWRLLCQQSARIGDDLMPPDQGSPKATAEGPATADSFPLVALLMDAIFGGNR